MSLNEIWRLGLRALLVFRFLVLAVACFIPLTHPDIIRQADTLGVTLRYWNRWTLEPSSFFPLFPALLNSGDSSGLAPTEFPALNLLLAPAFALGPRYGAVLARFGLWLIVGLLFFWVVKTWRGKKILHVNASQAFLALPLLSFAAPHVGKFMPDFLAVLLVLLSVGRAWNHKPNGMTYLVATLGLLIKPTSLVVFGLLYLSSSKKRSLLWVLVPVGVALLYYTLGTRFLGSLDVHNNYFYVKPRPPLRSMTEFLADGRGVLSLWFKQLFYPGALFLILFGIGWRRLQRQPHLLGPLWTLVLAQFLIIGALDGAHAHVHRYYFLGIAPAACLIFYDSVVKTPARWLGLLLLLGLIVHQLERTNIDLKPLWTQHSNPWLEPQCAELKKKHPEFPWNQGYVFRSAPSPNLGLGLCFGEREGSKTSEFGFYPKHSDLPPVCAPRGETESITLVQCP